MSAPASCSFSPRYRSPGPSTARSPTRPRGSTSRTVRIALDRQRQGLRSNRFAPGDETDDVELRRRRSSHGRSSHGVTPCPRSRRPLACLRSRVAGSATAAARAGPRAGRPASRSATSANARQGRCRVDHFGKRHERASPSRRPARAEAATRTAATERRRAAPRARKTASASRSTVSTTTPAIAAPSPS